MKLVNALVDKKAQKMLGKVVEVLLSAIYTDQGTERSLLLRCNALVEQNERKERCGGDTRIEHRGGGSALIVLVVL